MKENGNKTQPNGVKSPSSSPVVQWFYENRRSGNDWLLGVARLLDLGAVLPSSRKATAFPRLSATEALAGDYRAIGGDFWRAVYVGEVFHFDGVLPLS